jgi:hypothetical protein
VSISGAVAASPAAATVCEAPWGSLPKTAPWVTGGPVTNVRSGPQDCFDRLVIDLAGPPAGFAVKYVDQVRADGSGNVVPVRGGAKLQVTISSPSYDDNGNPTYRPANPRELTDVTGYRTFRQVVSAGSFEGMSDFGLGVRAQLPFRAFVLAGPGTSSRIVIDVAHLWY